MVGRARALMAATSLVIAASASGCAFLVRASVLQQPGQGNLDSSGGMTTPDGRYVLFDSASDNLVSNRQGNFTTTAYVRDRQANTLRQVAQLPDGTRGDGASFGSTITPDGRFVVFTSVSTNLVAGDTNGQSDVFIRDMVAGTIERVDVGSGGAQAPGGGSVAAPGHRAVSDDGRYVVFSAASNLLSGGAAGTTDVYVRDRQAGTTSRISVSTGGTAGDQISSEPTITADGRFVAFTSDADNLVANDTNFETDIFVRDRTNNTTTRVSVSTAGTQADTFSNTPSISGFGRYVTFTSFADNLVAGDTNSHADIFVRDTQTNTTTRASISSGSAQANNASLNSVVSRNGRYVLFVSSASNLVASDTNGADDIFLRDQTGGTTVRVSVASNGTQANDNSNTPAFISDDARWAGFDSSASNLVSGDTNNQPDVFLRDRQTPATTRESVSSEPNVGSFFRAAISANGRYIAFESAATNLVPNDNNQTDDIFVRDLLNNTTERVSVPNGGGESNGLSSEPSISDDGRYVAFRSAATNLVTGDTNNADDIFVRDRVGGTTIRVSNVNNGSQSNGNSFEPSITGDGLYVAYASDATNLVLNDTNATTDVFYTVASGGSVGLGTTAASTVAGSSFTANGRSVNPSISNLNNGVFFIAYQSDATNIVGGDNNAHTDIFRYQFGAPTANIGLTLAGNGDSTLPSIDNDGTVVAYQSAATNLVAGDTNGVVDVFTTLAPSLATTLQSRATGGGAIGNGASTVASISGDSRFVTFSSLATNLVSGDTNARSDVFLRDRPKSFTSRVSTFSRLDENALQSDNARISRDGRYVVFRTPGAIAPNGDDFNTVSDEYVRESVVPTLTSISASSGARGSTATYTFTGTYYFTGMQVNAGSGITVNNVNLVDEQHLSVNMTIASNATTGTRTIYVELPGTGPGTNAGATGNCNCFTVN